MRKQKEIVIGDKLKALRKSYGYTQEKLAQLLNVDQRTISNWENGISEPSLELLAKLCEIFNESFDNLLT